MEIVQLYMHDYDLKFYNSDLEWVYEPGDFEIMTGPDSGHLNVKRIKGV